MLLKGRSLTAAAIAHRARRYSATRRCTSESPAWRNIRGDFSWAHLAASNRANYSHALALRFSGPGWHVLFVMIALCSYSWSHCKPAQGSSGSIRVRFRGFTRSAASRDVQDTVPVPLHVRRRLTTNSQTGARLHSLLLYFAGKICARLVFRSLAAGLVAGGQLQLSPSSLGEFRPGGGVITNLRSTQGRDSAARPLQNVGGASMIARILSKRINSANLLIRRIHHERSQQPTAHWLSQAWSTTFAALRDVEHPHGPLMPATPSTSHQLFSPAFPELPTQSFILADM